MLYEVITDRATWVARLCTIIYFAFFILMPWYTARRNNFV